MLRKNIFWAMPLLLLVACHNSESREAAKDSVQSSDINKELSSETDTVSRKMIRTADLKCRVKNVFEATTGLERIVSRLNGAITESHIENEAFETKELAYKTDSLKKIQLYTPTSHLTLRVPEKYLDSVVNELSQIAIFINYRTLRQTDVSLQYLSNSLKNEANAQSRISIEKTEKNKLDLLHYKDDRQKETIDRKIENLQLSDNVKYATLTVMLFQPPLADISIQLDPGAISRTGFGEDLGTALQGGLSIFKSIALGIVSLWPLWILIPVCYAVYRRFGRSIVGNRKNIQ